ncbi:PREDICTED: uncharacterized protein LOC104827081 isoform X2 [Tarenaya hassleriana]|uniref:uncharacterized protein LOC104827081 isoform X2 n=1 Tax=Tarenaya hassleriana TaxID=28532 RepID=UPI00053C624B|nr:PREDICTED: uncharacterized protein LOC104827081 isoform X2 [Tarenaya hassleriana]
MSGSGGVSIARTAIRGENRFYNPPPMRRVEQEAQLQQMREKEKHKLEEEEETEKERRTAMVERKGFSVVGPPESKNRNVSVSEECGSSESSGSGRVANNASNLDRFLEHTTPTVMARCFPKRSSRESRNHYTECQPYFVLEDLWESFAEWSVYGAGVPLVLNGSDSVVQYYVPYLSGVQLYIDPTKSIQKSRELVEDGDGESLKGTTSSEGSSNAKLGKVPNNGKTQQKAVDINVRNLNTVSLKEQSLVGSTNNGSEISNPTGQLMFEYFEHDLPFGREPLANKVSVLASRFPELMTYRSCDLSSSSWVSVAWYPIYRIPIGPTLQNLDACFLTFHSLSTPPQSTSNVRESNHSGPSIKLPLPTFGLASYKLKFSVWNPDGTQECQKVNSLLQAAENWLKRLRINHPDYRFFTSHSSQMR